MLRINDLGGNGAVFRNLNTSKTKKTQQDYVQIMVVDLEPGATTWPTDYTPAMRVALSEPFSIAVDETTLPRLGVKLGDKAILANHLVKVAVILHNYANVNQPMIITSRDTLRLLGLAGQTDRTGPLMVKIAHPERAMIVRDQLQALGKGQFRVWTREELAKANDKALMKEQIIGLMMNFTIVLGGCIGVGITWQTLRGAILANIKEFASLRALGVSVGSLRQIVLELSFWVGIVGLVTTGVFVWGVTLLGKAGGVPLAYPPEYIAMAVVLLMVVAIGSGFLSLGVLKKSQPADLLR